MARVRVSLLRSLLGSRTLTPQIPCPSSIHRLPLAAGFSPPLRSGERRLPLPFAFHSCLRSFASTSSEASKIQLLGSAEQFDAALARVQDEKLPAIFYFTAVWCGPCRFITPTIEELNKKYPNVTTYKIDIDQEGLGTILNQLHISAVPTLHFYHDGKRAAEMVGADVNKLKETMENLYK